MSDTFETVVRVISQVCAVDSSTIKQDTTLEELGISSLDAIAIGFDLEESFGVSIEDEELRQLRTIQDIVNGINLLLKNSGTSHV